MYFYLEEITLKEGRELTELTWCFWCPKGNGKMGSSYAVRHKGADEADELMKQISPEYLPPPRYSDLVVLTAFLVDWASLNPGVKVFGTSNEQVTALMEYLAFVPWTGRSLTEGKFTTLQEHFSINGYESIVGELKMYRDKAVSRKGR